MNRPEEVLHKAVARFLDAALPSAVWWTSIPNQRGTRKRFEMGILKSLGVKAGAPDVIMCWEGRLVAIELKAPAGQLSPAQKQTSDKITLAGGLWTVCRSIDQVEDFLRMLGMPLRATMRAAA